MAEFVPRKFSRTPAQGTDALPKLTEPPADMNRREIGNGTDRPTKLTKPSAECLTGSSDSFVSSIPGDSSKSVGDHGVPSRPQETADAASVIGSDRHAIAMTDATLLRAGRWRSVAAPCAFFIGALSHIDVACLRCHATFGAHQNLSEIPERRIA